MYKVELYARQPDGHMWVNGKPTLIESNEDLLTRYCNLKGFRASLTHPENQNDPFCVSWSNKNLSVMIYRVEREYPHKRIM